MEISRNDSHTTIEMLERADQVLELTYHDWRLHEQGPQAGGTRKKNRPQKLAGGSHRASGFYPTNNHNAFA